MNIRTRLACVGVATGGLIAALVAPAGAADGQVLGADRATAIEGSYVVVIKPGARLDEVPGTVTRTYSSALPGFSATMTESQARRLAANPAVAYVEQDQAVAAAGEQFDPPSWGTDRVDQRTLPLDDKYTYATDASSVTAYVVDSGITITHEDFGGRAAHGRDTYDDDADASDCNGHGTHVAGTIGGSDYGLAKSVKLVGMKVFGCTGGSSNAVIIAAVDWIITNAEKPAVANFSLGGPKSRALDDAVQRLIDSGVTTVVSAGNEDADACGNSPASLPDAITVGASNITDDRWPYSNWGACLDLFAPGQDIVSAKWGTTDGYFATSGTSMAAPQVAGAAALYLSTHPSATHHDVRDALVGATTPDVLKGIGTGSPNKLLYTGPTGACATTTNSDATAIPDAGSTSSAITVSGCAGTASTARVAVDISHTYRGDLAIDLVAPDGTSYRLKNADGSDGRDDVVQTFTAPLSETRDGTWRLVVRDRYRADTGTLNSWSLTL